MISEPTQVPIFWKRAARAGFKLPSKNSELTTQYYPGTKCTILDGKQLQKNIQLQCQELVFKHRIVPSLKVILVGDDPASHVYVQSKANFFKKAGFLAETILLSATECTTISIVRLLEQLNSDSQTHGILVQLPLPAHVDKKTILSTIHPKKDVDGFHPLNAGLLASGEGHGNTGFIPCTPLGMNILLYAFETPLKGKHCVVIGRSNIVGRPMSHLALNNDCTVTTLHQCSERIQEICKSADILIAAAGKKHLVTLDYVKPGAVIVDVGIHRNTDGKITGDVSPCVATAASALSPVPGGVGPMTIASLAINTAVAAWDSDSQTFGS